MSERSDRRSMGLFGGTFDPVHIGHLRSALEIKEELKLDEMRLIPSFLPPHRNLPAASADERLTMVRLATDNTELTVDDREIARKGPSFSIDTLQSLRKEYPFHSISMVLGVDAFLGLTTWHQWEKIIELSNIIVIHPGFQFRDFSLSNFSSSTTKMKTNKAEITTLAEFTKMIEKAEIDSQIIELLEKHSIGPNEDIRAFQQGRIQIQKITLLDISGSRVRSMIAHGRSPRFLIPENVLKYIGEKQIYGYNSVSSSKIDEEAKKL